MAVRSRVRAWAYWPDRQRTFGSVVGWNAFEETEPGAGKVDGRPLVAPLIEDNVRTAFFDRLAKLGRADEHQAQRDQTWRSA